MDPRLIALINNSAGMTQLLPDEKLLCQIWLVAQFSGIPSDWTTISNRPRGLMTLSPDQQLNVQLYALANKLGQPNTGDALLSRVQASLGIPGKPNDFPELLLNVTLKAFGAYPVIV